MVKNSQKWKIKWKSENFTRISSLFTFGWKEGSERWSKFPASFALRNEHSKWCFV